MWILSLLFGLTLFRSLACQCTFPDSLAGTWVSSNDGTWDINSTHLLNFYTLSSTTGATIGAGVSQQDFTCYENQGDTKYAIKSEEFELLGAQRSVYTCIDITEISDNKLLYYHATEADPSGYQFTIQSVYENICNLASYEQPYNYHIALRSGSEASARQNCPTTMFGSYNYDTCTDPSSSSTSLDVCDSRQQLIYNYTQCNTTQMFSLEGVLDCVHHVDSDSITYLTLYNRDSTAPDNTNYYQYVCLAVEQSSSTVYVTARPNRCDDNQDSRTISSPGQALTLTPYYLCPITEESSSFNFLPIIIGVLAGILLLVIIGVILYCCCRRKCRKKQRDEEEAKSDSESEDEEQKPESRSESRSESRRTSKSSLEDEDENKSIDSGISEPPVTGRTDSNTETTDGDTKDQEKELVITAEGDKEIEDKDSRPSSGKQQAGLSRMSDLPPSTIPPDEDQSMSHRSEEDQLNEESEIENEQTDEVGEERKEEDDSDEEADKLTENGEESDHEAEPIEKVVENAEEEVKTDDAEEDEDDNEEDDDVERDEDDGQDIESEPPESDTEAPVVSKIDDDPEDNEQKSIDNKEKEDETITKDDEIETEDSETEEDGKDETKTDEHVTEDVNEDTRQENDNTAEKEDEEDNKAAIDQQDETEQKEEDDDQEDNNSEHEEKEVDEKQEKEDETQHESDLDIAVYHKGEPEPVDPQGDDTKPEEDQTQTKKEEDQQSQKEPDSEEENIKRRNKDLSSDEDEIQRKLVGGKKSKDYLTKGALTTVLVSREEEERKRQKLANKTKTQKMRKMAKKKTRRFGGKGTMDDKYRAAGDEYGSSDEETRRRGLREAPFMKQYEDKKHIEHILDEQHYWSDPEADKDMYRINDDMSSVFRSDYSSESEEEIVGIDTDGMPIRVRRRKRDKRKKQGDGDDISNADSEYLRQKMLKRAGSVDSMVSVEDPNNIDQRKSKRRLNEHVLKTDSDEEMTTRKDKQKTGDVYDDSRGKDDTNGGSDIKKNGDISANTQLASQRTKTITVKEHRDLTEDSRNDGEFRTVKDKRAFNKKGSYDFSDFSDSDMDKLSDRDSGMDDEEDVDVYLTPDQQQLIVGMLFDEEMNLRPQFTRDENGRIVRRLDNTVVYDPQSGRFTYRKRLGQIFKVPRLKRNDKGRPLGGYIDDEFGPKSDPSTVQRKASSAHRSQSGKSVRSSVNTRSPSADLKRTRADGKNVEFMVPTDEIDSLTDDQLEYNKRGRRDIGSAIRRKLNKRLFRKKRKLHSESPHGILPDVRVKKAWADDQNVGQGKGTGLGQGGVSPLTPRGGRFSSSSPWVQRRTPGPGDAGQWQMYREGLQSDRRILESLQDKLNTRDPPFAPREAFVENGEGDQTDERDRQYVYDREHEDGLIGIRERGCPELKQQKVPFFTIVRRPGDLESQEQLNAASAPQRNANSAPLHVQEYNDEYIENGQTERTRMTSEDSLVARSHDGRYSQMTSIDDNRLRRLLEELYKDKKYFDNYIESTDPKSKEFKHSQGLAEHGRGYLLKRANYWERRGPLPPRPPMTAVGWKMQRQQTLFASRQASELGVSTATCTPDLSVSNMPGVVESPRNEQIREKSVSRSSPNESYA